MRARGGASAIADGRGRLLDDLVEQLGDAEAGLGRGEQHVGDVAADDAGQLGGVLVDLRGRQVDLVQHRDDVEVGAEREVEVGQRLRLDALGRVDQQYGGLAGLQAARDLVGEVDVAGRVDHVEHVAAWPRFDPVPCCRFVSDGPGHADGLALDGDAALALDVHAVEVLRPGAALVDDPGQLEHPVGQRRLAVVDVGDDAEVADQPRVGLAGRGRGLGHVELSARRRWATGSECA